MRTLIVLSLLLFGTVAEAALTIDDFGGPGFNLCVNQPNGTPNGSTQTPCFEEDNVSDTGGVGNNRETRLLIENAPDDSSDPNTPGNLIENGNSLTLSVGASSNPLDPQFPQLEIDSFDVLYSLGGPTNLPTFGDRFLIDLITSNLNLGNRMVDLTVTVSQSVGSGVASPTATGTIQLSSTGTYEIPFSNLFFPPPPAPQGFPLVEAGSIFLEVDFRNAIVGPGINLEFNNFRVGVAAVPTPSAMLLMGSGLLGLVAWRWMKDRRT